MNASMLFETGTSVGVKPFPGILSPQRNCPRPDYAIKAFCGIVVEAIYENSGVRNADGPVLAADCAGRFRELRIVAVAKQRICAASHGCGGTSGWHISFRSAF